MTDTLDLIFKFLCTNSGNCMLLIVSFVIVLFACRKDDKPTQHLFCKDCRYFVPHPDGRLKYATCSKFPQNLKQYLVSGDVSHKECRYCCIMRDNENRCGVSGKYYEKKEETK